MDSWKDINVQGVRCYEQGRFDEAYSLFKRAYQLSPRVAALAYNLGMAALSTDRREEARLLIGIYQDLVERACPYFIERDRAGCESVPLSKMGREALDGLLERGFRRTGRTMSRNVCPECRDCVQMRVRLAEFRPSRGQRRVLRINADLRVEAAAWPEPNPGKAALMGRYLVARHEWIERDFTEELEECYSAWEGCREFRYYLEDSLVMAGIVDLGVRDAYVSTCFFEPGLGRRSLGIFNILTVIGWARSLGLRYLYTGEYILARSNMAYKRLFRPHDILGPDGSWEDDQV